jgi:hypothetical protein
MNQAIPPSANPPSQPKTSALAIWSLALGVLSLVIPCLMFITAIPGVICGHRGLAKINKSGGALTGNGLAIAGLITSYVGIVWGVFVIALLTAIAIPNYEKARAVSMQNACINNLRQIEAAKNEWALETGKDAGAVPTATDLTPYFKNGKFPVCPAGGTYTIGAVSNAPTCNIPGHALDDDVIPPGR